VSQFGKTVLSPKPDTDPALLPVPRGPVPVAPEAAPRRQLTLTIDGRKLSVPEGTTLLEATRQLGIDTPTLCYLETLAPVNVCRVCVVELEGSRTLVPACSRKAEEGMVISTDSERVRLSRRLVLEFLSSSVDVSTSPRIQAQMAQYGANPDRFGPRSGSSDDRDAARSGSHHAVDGHQAATVSQSVKIDNELYVRDYGKCILCYKCVEACGKDAQNTFAIAVVGRGFDARISTEYATPLPDSACVYCGNCIGVCPTGALMFKSEYDMRQAGTWDESKQTETDTICPYCGVGCTLTVHAQDERIVKVTSPTDSGVTRGHLCIKGRFGWQFVNTGETREEPGSGKSLDQRDL
jgi:predicted molibdopterin-dependent oxidoreductase YjgC